MADDIKVLIDNSPVIKDLTDLGKAIDSLETKLQKLDKTNLKTVRAEIANRRKSPFEAVQNLAQIMDLEFANLAKNPAKNIKTLGSALKKSFSETFLEVRTGIAEEIANTKNYINNSIAHMVAQAQAQANKSKAPFTPISWNRDKTGAIIGMNPGASRYMAAGSERATAIAIAAEIAEAKARNAAFDALEKQSNNNRITQTKAMWDALETVQVVGANRLWTQKEAAAKAEQKIAGQLAATQIAMHAAEVDAVKKYNDTKLSAQKDYSKKSLEGSFRATSVAVAADISDAKSRSATYAALDKQAAKDKVSQINSMWDAVEAANVASTNRTWKQQDQAAKESKKALGRRVAEEIAMHNQELDAVTAIKKTQVARQKQAYAALWQAEANNANADYTKFNPTTGARGGLVKSGVSGIPDIDPGDKNLSKLHNWATAFSKFGAEGGYAHSAVRGLASGFNLLWLTWGATAPLLAGAAISNMFVAIIKEGSNVEHTLTKIKALSGATAVEVAGLKKELLAQASSGSPFNPQEIAEAMKTLSLAGLDTKQVFESIKPVLNFSVAGDTSISKAADVISGVATAFKYGAEGYEYVADIIAKTAASTKSSVESMGEAFKTSSVVYTQYGASLKDVALVQGLLANVNVTGTAAGTATRNMLADLTGRTPKAVKALKDVGMSMDDIIDKEGKIKPLEEVFTKLVSGLEKKTGPAQFDVIRRIFSERGEKGAAEMMDGLFRKAEKTGESVLTVFKKLQQDIDNSSAFTIIAAAEMSLTSLNQMKSVASTFKATLVEAFDYIRPAVVNTATTLRELFKSDKFKSDIASLGMSIADLTVFIVENGKALITMGVAMLGLQGAMVALSGLAKGFLAFNAAATVTSGLMAALAATPVGIVITGIAVAAGAVAIAMNLWSNSADNAARSTKLLVNDDGKALLERLREEETRLIKINEARSRGISLQELEASMAAVVAKSSRTTEQLQATQELFEAEKEYEKVKAAKGNNSGADNARGSAGSYSMAKTAVEVAKAKLLNANAAAKEQALALDQTATNLAQLRKADEKRLEAERAKASGRKYGKEGPTEDTSAVGMGQRAYERALQESTDFYNKSEALLNKSMSNAQAILNAQHRAKLIDDAEYASKSLDAIRKFETDKTKLIADSNAKNQAILAKEKDDLVTKFGKSAVEKYGQMTDQQIAAITDRTLRGQAQSVRDFFHKSTMESQRAADEAASHSQAVIQRVAISTVEFAGNLNENVRSIDGSILKVDKAITKLEEGDRAAKNLLSKSPWETAGLEAYTKTFSDYGDELEANRRKVEELVAAHARLKASMDYGPIDEETSANLTSSALAVANGKAKLDTFSSRVRNLADKNQVSATKKSYEDAFRAWTTEVRDGLTDAVATAVFEGGAAGGKKMRAMLEQQLIRRPFTIILNGMVDKIMGGSVGSNVLEKIFGLFSGGRGGTPDMSDVMGMPNRAGGGPVSANSMYRVNELGMEMLSVAGKDYLMTGAQSGMISPAGSGKGITIVSSPTINIDSRSDQAQVAMMVDRAVKAGNAKLVDDLKAAGAI